MSIAVPTEFGHVRGQMHDNKLEALADRPTPPDALAADRVACSHDICQEILVTTSDPHQTTLDDTGHPNFDEAPRDGTCDGVSVFAQIAIDDIRVVVGGDASEEVTVPLLDSIRSVGLIHPVTVRQVDGAIELVAGHKRLEAMRHLGATHVPCTMHALDDRSARLLAIDENLARKRLGAAESALLLAERRRLHEAKHGSAKARGACAANRAMGRDANATLAVASSTEIATRTGRSARSIQRDAARGAALPEDTMRRLVGTSLDSGREIDALARLPEAVRDEFVRRAALGEKISAARGDTNTAPEPDAEAGPSKGRTVGARDDTKRGYATLKAAWHAACPRARVLFLAWIACEAPSGGPER